MVFSGWGKEGMGNDFSWVSGYLFSGKGNCLKLGNGDGGITLNYLETTAVHILKGWILWQRISQESCYTHMHAQNLVSRRPNSWKDAYTTCMATCWNPVKCVSNDGMRQPVINHLPNCPLNLSKVFFKSLLQKASPDVGENYLLHTLNQNSAQQGLIPRPSKQSWAGRDNVLAYVKETQLALKTQCHFSKMRCTSVSSPCRPSFCTNSQTKWGWSWSDPEERQGGSSKRARDTGKLCPRHGPFPSSLLLLIPGPSQHLSLPSAAWGSPGTLPHPHQINLITPYILTNLVTGEGWVPGNMFVVMEPFGFGYPVS